MTRDGNGRPDVTGQRLARVSCITSVLHWTIHERARAEERILPGRLAALA
ncbi:hypothetical protein [Arthrobacter sp. MP_M7]|nr:hypothetical protein [Arthrobacter sp. MP_M4]MEC5202517.1 hypothetical protein [Arthrobacter sp. MP_M7]